MTLPPDRMRELMESRGMAVPPSLKKATDEYTAQRSHARAETQRATVTADTGRTPWIQTTAGLATVLALVMAAALATALAVLMGAVM